MTVSTKTVRTRRRAASERAPDFQEDKRLPIRTWLYPSLALAFFLLGLLTSAVAGVHPSNGAAAERGGGVKQASAAEIDFTALMEAVNPPEGYRLPASYNDLGPRLLQSGAIDYGKFTSASASSGDPLTPEEIAILKQSSSQPIIITAANAHFLLNFFWAVGLANANPILTEGPLTQYSEGQIDRFASTGGWSLGSQPVAELFASADLIELTAQQQGRVVQVASMVYRPCCDNPALFPDCNHGMAMLGLLELMASQGASADQMLSAAKYVNAYWFPQQTAEIALYLEATQHTDFSSADPRVVVARQFASGSGSSQLHAGLQAQGIVPGSPNEGGSCGT